MKLYAAFPLCLTVCASLAQSPAPKPTDALTRQNRIDEASWVERQLDTAWQGADIELKSKTCEVS